MTLNILSLERLRWAEIRLEAITASGVFSLRQLLNFSS